MTPRPAPLAPIAVIPVIAVIALIAAALLLVAAPARAGTDPVGVWPLSPEPDVVAGFDPPEDPWGAGHRGVDLLGTPGQVVRAALPGRVSWAGVLAGRGVVVVDHGATRTTYEPVETTVAMGEQVSAGDRLGTLSPVGSHCAPRACLHWGWIEGETYLDPLRLVGAGPVRLLPLWQDAPVAAAMSATMSATTPAARSSPYAAWRPPMALLGPVLTPVDVLAGRPAAVGRW